MRFKEGDLVHLRPSGGFPRRSPTKGEDWPYGRVKSVKMVDRVEQVFVEWITDGHMNGPCPARWLEPVDAVTALALVEQTDEGSE